MLTDVFGLIYASEDNFNLRDLVMHRSLAALPLGGRYRAIDFLLSNMVHSGIRNVGIITQKNYKSLMDHIGSGKEWDLSRKKDGLYLLPPFDTNQNTHFYEGFCDAVHSKLDYLHRATQNYCLLTGSYTIYSTSYEKMMQVHKENQADITLLYSTEDLDFPNRERFKDVRLAINEEGRVTDIEFESNMMRSPNLGMDIYLMDKSLLEYLVQTAVSHGKYNFVTDVLIPHLQDLRIYAVPHQGYVSRLHSVASYYDINMDMLKEKTRRDLFPASTPVYTKIKDEPSAKYLESATVKNCILGDGCEIGGHIEDSVLFRGVSVGRNTTLKGVIVMQDSVIGQDCHLEHVIIDKLVQIHNGVRLIGTPDFPAIIRKGAVI